MRVLVRVGTGISVVYALVVACLVARRPAGEQLWALSPNNLGDFLAGAAAPLAFLWLIIGFFLQREQLNEQRRSVDIQSTELAHQREELRLQREELRAQRVEAKRLGDETARQAKSIEHTELTTRRDVLIKYADIATDVQSSLALVMLEALDPGAYKDCLKRLSEGHDDAAFDPVRDRVTNDPENSIPKIQRNERGQYALPDYLQNAVALAEELKGVDLPLREFFERHSMMRLYRALRDAQKAADELAARKVRP